MNAIEPFVPGRSLDTIYADIEAQRRVVNVLRNLATDFINTDLRPMIYDGTSVQRIGPSPIPPELRKWLDSEARNLAILEHEFHIARRAERPPPLLNSASPARP